MSELFCFNVLFIAHVERLSTDEVTDIIAPQF